MKLKEFEDLKTESNIDFEQINYTLNNNGKIFDIIFDHIYPNKIKAVLREIGANAYDAHILAGKANIPIDIVLPSKDDPTLIIRDYGPGLSKDEVRNIYINKGNSRSGLSDETIGCYGIGAGAIFCYSDSFITTSFHQGKKYLYVHTRDEQGIPYANLVSQDDTDETGFEVKIPCKTTDTDQFKSTAKVLFRWFNPQPNITPTLDLDKKIIYEDEFCVITSSNEQTTAVLMGGIAYTLSPHSIGFDYFSEYYKLLNSGKILVKASIGDISIDAGREQLQYTDATKDFIKKRCGEIIESAERNIAEKIEKCKNLWEANTLFNELILTFPIPLKKCEYNGKRVTGSLNLTEEVSYIEKNFHKIRKIVSTINIKNNIVFADNDIKTSQYKSGLNLLDKTGKDRLYYLNDTTPILRQEVLAYGGEILKLSDYFVPPEKNTGSRKTGIVKEKVFEYDWTGRSGLSSLSSSNFWKKTEVDLNAGGVYVGISRYQIDGLYPSSNIKTYKAGFEQLGLTFPKDIYGVKLAVKHRFGKHKRWTLLNDYIKEKLTSFLQNKSNLLEAFHDYKSTDRHKHCYNHWFIDELRKEKINGELGDYLKRLKEIEKNANKINALNNLIYNFSIDFIVNSDLQKVREDMNNKYYIDDCMNNRNGYIKLIKKIINLEQEQKCEQVIL